jgi:hypothetical protein
MLKPPRPVTGIALPFIYPRGGGLEYLHRSYVSRKKAMKGEPGAWGNKWATLSLGDINTETWYSGLGVWRKVHDLAL